MARLFLFLLFSLCCNYGFTQSGERVKKIHSKAILVDAHNDILTTIATDSLNIETNLLGKTHSDIYRFAQGGVDVQIFSIWCDGKMQNPYQWANREIDSLYAVAFRNPQQMQIAYSPNDIKKIVSQNKLAAIMGMEGGHMMEDDLNKLDSLYKRGVRYMTLTWNNSTSWASSALDETTNRDSTKQKGLTNFGKQIVSRMNELGMMVDLSHVGEQTFWDAINTTSKPVIVSHSCVHALCPVFRNLKDEQIKAVGKNGGVICLNFYSGFLDSNFNKRNAAFNERHKAERDSIMKTVTDSYFASDYMFKKYAAEVQELRAPLSLMLDHLDYLVKLAGINHVGLGSDFDGISSTPQSLDGVQDFPNFTEALFKRGYSKKSIRKILGGNILRVFAANSK
ncbi:MAG: membrane dipeptidase [Chitinophagaceae bacterium]|nr:MAG: membrane dipeptidase [Chitinophagaceae bacterium]